MIKNAIRTTAILLILGIAISSLVLTASAISWDGSSAGGGGGGRPGTAGGYAIRSTDLDKVCIGYRFSVVDKGGTTKAGPVDVFRNTSGGNAAIKDNNTFSTKLSKKQLIDGQNNSYATSKSTTNCLWESGMEFASALPAPSGIEKWQNSQTNLNKVFSWMGVGSVDKLKNGDKLLIEPMWDVRLKSIYHSLTTTELAIYGKWLLGADSDGGSSTTSDSWGFISRFSNREFPNSLYTPEGKGLWTGVSAIDSTKRGTFKTIINSGYGVGIGYTETRPDINPALSVRVCEAWKGALSTRSFHYGTSNGSEFGNFTYANSYPIMGDNIWFSVHFPKESENVTVRQYVRLKDGNWNTRDVATSSEWYDVSLSPTTVDSGRSSYIIEAKVDWIEGGTIKKYGVVKTFYIPVRPKINRHQVTLYDITGTQVARNGADGKSGSVYVGQKVNQQFTFTSTTTWTSNNNYGIDIDGVRDLTHMKTDINNNSPVVLNSPNNPYIVPNATSISYDLITSWNGDAARVREVTAVPISVIKADVELKEIRLIDENGNYVDGNTLYVHQKVTPQYVYKNNTNIRVFVEGYDNDKTRVGGADAVYAIPAKGEIAVNGKQITISNVTSQSFWGGVYLDGAGINNTMWESTGTNNDKTVTYTVVSPLKIQTIMPNSFYRERTVVMTSFKVQNNSPFNYIPAHKISVKFTALNGSKELYAATKTEVVIPANGDNLVFFKWTVPSGLNDANITLKGEVIEGGNAIDAKSFSHGSEKPPVSQTSDTIFEKTAPAGFRVVSLPSRTGSQSAQWSEWVYEGSKLVKKTYGLNLNAANAPALVPDVNSPTREQKDGVWHMGSGYGFTQNWKIGIETLKGTLAPAVAAYTNSQLCMIYFPEYKYSMDVGSFRVLNRTATNTFQFPVNPNATNNARLHFIPLWYPNGNYRCQGYVGDVWTPAGMLSRYYTSNTMTITGTAYDDWYVTGR